MCDANKMNRARDILARADEMERAGAPISESAEGYWNRAEQHIQDERGHLALVEANKLAAELGIVLEDKAA